MTAAGPSELTGEVVAGLQDAPRAAVAEREVSSFEIVRPGRAARGRSRAMPERASLQRRALAIADIASAALALLVAVTILGDDSLSPLSLLGLPLIVLAGKALGLYDREELVLRSSTLEEAPRLFQLATLYALVIWLLEGLLVSGHLGQRQILGLWAVLILSSLLARSLARSMCRALAPAERCLVMGDPSAAEQLGRKLDADPAICSNVVESVGLEEREGQIPWSAPALSRLVSEHAVDRVIIAPRHADSGQVLDLVRTINALGVQVSICPRLLEVVGSSVEFDDVNGMPLLGIHPFRISRSTRLLKRAFDVVGAGIGLLLLSPLLALIGAAIKVDSRGPILFRQRRIGRDGDAFQIVKFRTMVEGAEQRKGELLDRNEAQGLFKIRDDPRITTVGRLLRRSSLDELPQLWNVLRGQMSLVGPRPLVGEEDCRVTGWDRTRLQLTPGMTGPWQVLGSARVPLSEMVKIDYLYTANWSLWTDVKLLLRTFPHVVRGRGQ